MTINPAEFQSCPDFSTSTGLPGKSATVRRAEGAAAAAGLKLTGRELHRFCQGFTHARQGRDGLTGDCPHYDAGHAAGRADRRLDAPLADTGLLTGVNARRAA